MADIIPPKRLHKLAIYHDGKMLILKRSKLNAYYPEFWGLPTAMGDEGGTDPSNADIIHAIQDQYTFRFPNQYLSKITQSLFPTDTTKP